MPDLRAGMTDAAFSTWKVSATRGSSTCAAPPTREEYNILYAQLMRIDHNLRAAYRSYHGDARANEPKYVLPGGRHRMRPFKAFAPRRCVAATCAAGQTAMVNSCDGRAICAPKALLRLRRVLDGDGVLSNDKLLDNAAWYHKNTTKVLD